VEMQLFNIPRPFVEEKFEVFQKGISDDPMTDVYINEDRDFLFLHPTPRMDYDDYTPRVKKYGLDEYKKKLQVFERRLDKIEHLLENKPCSLLEIGAGDGGFLTIIRQRLPKIQLTAVDKDQNTLQGRVQNSDENYGDLDALQVKSRYYDFICLFHVLEHLLSPSEFLAKIRGIMSASSLLIIEVPSFLDPLLSLYGNPAYSKFYFQRQHPYIYSPHSLERLMEANGFKTVELINHQRYGLENHLNWLSQGRPGGNDVFQTLFSELESDYIRALERSGKTDTVIWVGKGTS
jgi:ubiquinone/menaquinone biosynthesis C-methylase UbiE